MGNLQKDAKTYLDALRCECAAPVSSPESDDSNGLSTGPHRRDDLAFLLCGPSQRCALLMKSDDWAADAQGAMAGHAYKAAVDELDTGVGRDLVRTAIALILTPSLMHRTPRSARRCSSRSASSTRTLAPSTQRSRSAITRCVSPPHAGFSGAFAGDLTDTRWSTMTRLEPR